MLVAVVVAAFGALPADAISRTLGTAADPGLSGYIGQVVRVRPGSSFVTPPPYVDGVRTSGGLVLLWAGRRLDGTQCSGIAAAFDDPDIVRHRSWPAGRSPTTALPAAVDRFRSAPAMPGSRTAGNGSLRVEYGQVPARVHVVRVTFEDGRTQRAISFSPPPPPPPPFFFFFFLKKKQLAAVRTSSGIAQLRLSAPGRGWQRQQCWGAVIDGHSTPILCSYPASFAPGLPQPSTNNLFLYGPRLPGIAIAIATRADQAWLVAADHSVRSGRVVLLTLAGSRQMLVIAATGRGRNALTGIVTSRGGWIVGALLMAGREGDSTTTAPCFLAAPSAGAPAASPACRALMAIATRRVGVARA